MKLTLALIALLLAPLAAHRAAAEDSFAGWKHSGTLAILTTPAGANLPAAVREQDFPILVRLDRETFDFSQAQPHGADVRFSADGKQLAYQIDYWDTERGSAAIWVRIPVIQGNARQLITMHWGHADAKSESNGAAVFNASNGYVVAMHLGDSQNPVKDEVGTVTPVDTGTTSCPSLIGLARRFDVGNGIACGEKITGLPVGSEANTTQAWFRAEKVNTIVVGWGNEQAQGKVIMGLRSPPHMNMDCYFSSGNVASKSRLPMGEWVQVVHTYTKGDSRIYVNGGLEGVTSRTDSPLNIRTPARLFVGGWYGNFQFVGEIDEVRVSKVARSADWIKLEYENQKPLQTLVGTLVQPGSELSVSEPRVAVNEGQSVTLHAKANGAEKVYWVHERDGEEKVVAVDRLSYTFAAGRVNGDTTAKIRFKAIFPTEAKTIDVPVTIKEAIPEPKFTLQAPANWFLKDAIEVVPVISNLDALKATGAAELHYRWTVSGGAVIKQIAPDRLILKRSQFVGPLRVTAAIDNGGAATMATATIDVREGARGGWVPRMPEKNEKPEEGQFYACNSDLEGTLHYNGKLDEPAEAVFLKLYADDDLIQTETQPLAADKSYAFTIKLRAFLCKYRVEFGMKTGDKEVVLDRVGDLVCGHAFLIDGQSNALATDTGEDAPRETNEWIRSYAGPTGRGDGAKWVQDRNKEAQQMGLTRPNLWCRPVWKANKPEHKAELGYWGMELARRLVEKHGTPIFIINAAVGGSRIDEHQPTPDDHADLKTMYGRMLWRVQQARLTHGIRAVIWHQGENDQGADGPTGGYGWETYQQYFIDMSGAWKEDMPNIEQYYMFQIWPNACAMGGREGSGDRLREAQRTLPGLYSNLSILSTCGIQPPGGCHYPLAGWAEFARLLEPLIERDFYHKKPVGPITAPNLDEVRFTTAARDEIRLAFDQPVVWNDALASQFYLDDVAGEVVSGKAVEHIVTLKLKSPSAAKKITYLKERDWNQNRLLVGANGIAALTFCDVEFANSP